MKCLIIYNGTSERDHVFLITPSMLGMLLSKWIMLATQSAFADVATVRARMKRQQQDKKDDNMNKDVKRGESKRGRPEIR